MPTGCRNSCRSATAGCCSRRLPSTAAPPAVMAADLAGTPDTGIRVQACGDCHLMNFGGFATPERNVIFDINDFDETLPAPWEWDVKRLVASFVLAARSHRTVRRERTRCRGDLRAQLPQAPARIRRDASARGLVRAGHVGRLSSSLLPESEAAARAAIGSHKATTQSGSEVDFPKLAGMVGGRLSIRDTPPLIFHPEEARSPDFQTILDQTSWLPTGRRWQMTAAFCSTATDSWTLPSRSSVSAASGGDAGSP